jgi:thymidylate synthase (FAD)
MEPEVSVYPNEVECGEQDIKLINRVALQFKHQSTMEHLVYNFSIKGISRACLQELARHRIASLSVKSTRYTLKELKNEETFNPNYLEDRERAYNYLVSINEEVVDTASILALENLRKILVLGISNDKAKYCLPEAYKTDLTWTINARSLSNFLYLRSAKAALPEIRELSRQIYSVLPVSHHFLFPLSTDE